MIFSHQTITNYECNPNELLIYVTLMHVDGA